MTDRGVGNFPQEQSDTLVNWAKAWGMDPWRVQGPGANLSAKHGDRMRIKASGTRLDDGANPKSWTDVSVTRCLKETPAVLTGTPGRAREDAYANMVLRAPIVAGSPRPSMELGMHGTLPWTYVAHLHSLGAILLDAMAPGHPLYRSIRKTLGHRGFKIYRVPPVKPGLALTWAVAVRTNRTSEGALFLLGGHGAIWVHDCPLMLYETEAEFELTIREALSLDLPFPGHHRDGDRLVCDFGTWPSFEWDHHPAFPDFAVFFPDPENRPLGMGSTVVIPSGVKEQDAVELVFAQALLATKAKELAIDVALPPKVANTVATLQLERLRRGH